MEHKKYILVIITAILLGIFFGDIILHNYQEELVIQSDGNIYYLEYGAYVSKDVIEECQKKLNYYLHEEIDNKYYLYLGAYINYHNALKLKEIFEKQGISLYIKNTYLGNSKLLKKITKLEEKLNKLEQDEEILEVNKEIISLLKEELENAN